VHPSQLKLVSGVTPATFIGQMAELGYRCHLLGAGVLGPEVTDVHTNGVESVVFVPR
jgi:hypothetical protein